jgi:Na+/melibiose symporter-like transporter
MLNRAMGVVSALSTVLIRERDLDERVATGRTQDENAERSWTYLLRDRIFFFLFISIFFFHFANAPILPTVALYVKKLGGSDKLMTATVLTAQIVMTPIALLAGRFCDSWGRKPVMAIAFWILPLRILFLYVRLEPRRRGLAAVPRWASAPGSTGSQS